MNKIETEATNQQMDAVGPRRYAALQGVGRAMVILEALARQPMRAKDLAETLGLKWTTAHRTLTYFEEQGYLERNPATGEYSIGARVYALGTTYLVRHQFAHASGPHLRAAAERMQCGAQANERQALTVITIAAIDPPTDIPKTSPGFAFPLGVAAKGQVLLAFAPEEVREDYLANPLPAFTKHSVTDAEQLRERLERIRADGYAVTREDLQLGVGSAAAAVRDAQDAVIGCMSLVVRSVRMDDEEFVTQLADSAKTASAGVSLALGWHPRPRG
jgi:DNA-binding IclR family transcriptional regulator